MNHKGTQILKTVRLVLRQIVPEDAEMVFRFMGDPEVCKYECYKPHPNCDYSRGYILEVLDYSADNSYHWGIEFLGRLIGTVCVVNVDDFHKKATPGYSIVSELWSKGITTEAVKAVLDYMFMEIGLNRIEASHAVNNIGSGRVLEKAGMELEGLAKEYFLFNVGYLDSKLFGLTKNRYLSSLQR